MSLTITPTTVIDVRGKDRLALLDDSNFLYVGYKARGWPESMWSNPYLPENCGVTHKGTGSGYKHAARLFELRLAEAISGRIPRCSNYDETMAFIKMADHLNLLRGLVLGCKCGDWVPGQEDIHCHAMMLAKAVNAMGAAT